MKQVMLFGPGVAMPTVTSPRRPRIETIDAVIFD